MAYFEPKTKEILLSQEEKAMFKEFDVNIASKKTPITDKLIKYILTGNKKEDNYGKQR